MFASKVELPAEVVDALGPDPEREVIEGVLLLLVSEGIFSGKHRSARLGEMTWESLRDE